MAKRNRFNWHKWTGYNLYKKLWSLIGGRPWTFIYRDLWHTVEILGQVQWFWTAVLVFWLIGVDIPIKLLGVLWGVYILGYINGHFFWGTNWKQGQKGD